MATVTEQLQSLRTEMQGIRTRLLAVLANDIMYSALGESVVYGCKVTQGASADDMVVALEGQAAGDSDRLNPDIADPPTRGFEYPNIASLKDGAFRSLDLTATVADPPATGLGRYDIAYIYVGPTGAGFAIASGTPAVGVKTAFDNNGLDDSLYPSESGFDPVLPIGAMAVGRIYVEDDVTGIQNARIADIRGFTGRFSNAILAAETIAPHIEDIQALAAIIAEIEAVADNAANINTVAAADSDIDTIVANLSAITTAVANLAAIIAAPDEAAAAAASAASAAASMAKLTGTSATSATPSIAEKVLTTQSDKDFDAGSFVTVVSSSDPAVYMYGPVTSYSGTTLTFTPTNVGEPETKADWMILGRCGGRGEIGPAGAGLTDQAVGFTATGGVTPRTLTVDANLTTSAVATLAGAQALTNKTITYAGNTLTGVQPTLVSGTNIRTVNSTTLLGSGDINTRPGDHCVTVHTGNGYGSTNNKIRRFTTTLENTGTAITYADSAANGASFTINENGLYEIYYRDRSGAPSFGVTLIGISVNSAQLTTSIEAISIANRLALALTIDAAGGAQTDASLTRTVKLSNGDVIRPHTGGGNAETSNVVFFSIRKVGDV